MIPRRFYSMAGMLLVAFGVLLLLQHTALACPTCKEATATNGADTASGYFYSILFMLSMPPLIFSGISLYFYLLVRRARAEAAAKAAQVAMEPAVATIETDTRELVEV